MGIVLLVARLLLAGVFLVAGLGKLADRAGSRPAIVDFGESYLQGMKLALKDYTGKRKIEFVVYDYEANPQKAVSLVQRLMQNDKVPLIIGTVSSGNVLAFAPIMQKAGVPLIAGPSIASNITSQFIEEKPSFIFRCSMVEKFQIDGMLDWGVKTFKKIGLIHSTTGYGNFAAKEIVEGIKARGRTTLSPLAYRQRLDDAVRILVAGLGPLGRRRRVARRFQR